MNWPARALVLGSVAVLGFLAACGGPSSAPETPTATATAEPSASPAATEPGATPTATAPGGIPVREWTILPPRPLPDGLALIIEKGCWGCDGPSSHLERVYRDASGTVRVEEVFRPSAGSSINGTAFTRDFSEMAVMVCVAAESCGGMAPPKPGARSTLVRSTDGGMTWSEVKTFEEPLGLVTILRAGYAISVPSSAEDAELAALFAYPSREWLGPPAGAEDPALVVSYGTRLLWRDANKTGFLGVDGSPMLTTSLAGLADPQYGVWWLGGNPLSETMLVTPIRTGSDLRQVVAVYREGKLTALWRAPFDSSTLFNLGAWIDDHTAVGNVTIAYEPLRAAILAKDPGYPITGGGFPGYAFSFPAVIDVEAGTVTPIEVYGALSAPYEWNRNLAAAIQRGPFARVTVGAGACLNVRVTPSLRADIMHCVADGVLLTYKDRQTESSEDGIRWLRVTLPGAKAGWASTGYLEY